MKVGQATFLSDSTINQGRADLVARSRDIDELLVTELLPWIPCCWEMSQQKFECFNFFKPCAEKLAVSRSVLSRLDNRRAEAIRITTSAVVFEPRHLTGFHDNVIMFMNAIRTMGALLLPQSANPELPILNVPDCTIFTVNDYAGNVVARETGKIVRAIDIHQRVAILGVTDSMRFLCSFIAQLPVERRYATSFSTGLDISDRRPFNLQFFSLANADLKRELVQAQVRTISLECLEAISLR